MPNRRDALLLFYRRRPGHRPPVAKVDPHTLAYFGAMLILIGLAGWLYLHQASEVAAYAREIREMEQRKEALHREIVALRGEAAMLGSLKRVLDVGDQLGYRLPKALDAQQHVRVEYQTTRRERARPVTHLAPGAMRESVTLPGPESPEIEKNKGFFRRLVEQLALWLESPIDSRPAGRTDTGESD